MNFRALNVIRRHPVAVLGIGGRKEDIPMALNGYLKIAGQKQGQIRGSVTQKGREGSILVTSANHTVDSPRDPATGQALGKRQHGPIRITKSVDLASPRLYTALTMNERLTTWEFLMYELLRDGTERQYYTIRLTNAVVSRIEFELPNTLDPALNSSSPREVVSFVYEGIEWVWTDGGIAARDTWWDVA